MFITSVYLSTYNETTPISGRMTVKTAAGEVQMEIPVDICHSIQNSLVAAWVLRQQKLAEEILGGTPALVALPSPEQPVVEEAEYEEANQEGETF